MKKADLSILIGSCDAYADVAALYVKFLRKYWPDCQYDIYVTTDTLKIEEPDVISVTNEMGLEWADRVKQALRMIESKYVWLTVDDLFICQNVDSNRINEIISIMKNDGLEYYGFPSVSIKEPFSKKYFKGRRQYKSSNYMLSISRDVPYGVNMGTDIWEKDALYKILDDGIETAWDVENYFLEKSSKTPGGYYEHYVYDNGTSLKYAHMIKKGKWIQKGIKEIDDSGIYIDYSERGYVPLSSRLRTLIVGTGNFIFPIKSRASVKKILTKVGFKFATKY